MTSLGKFQTGGGGAQATDSVQTARDETKPLLSGVFFNLHTYVYPYVLVIMLW